MKNEKIAVVIQAGGRSTRMRQNKALLDLAGKTIIEHTLDRVSGLGKRAFVISDDSLSYGYLKDVEILRDMFPGHGPLGGMVTAFEKVPFPILVMCACDMPFASSELFQKEIELLVNSDLDVVIPEVDGRMEPLHAVYRRQSCLEPANEVFRQGGRKIIDWFSQVKVKVLGESDLSSLNINKQAFFNINTPEDYQNAKFILSISMMKNRKKDFGEWHESG
jgi:molybdenum cofactor guanylyltransferase